MSLYEKKILLKSDKKEVFAFHERPGALKRLSPPWQKIDVIRHKRGIDKGASVKMHLYDPFKITWKAKHTEFIKNEFFEDIQTFGPFAFWKHQHIFEDLNKNLCSMTDRIEFKLYFHELVYPASEKILLNKLNKIFHYRHKILQRDLIINSRFKDKKTILISGASGVIGRLLIPKLTTAGHEVRTLVRRYPENETEFYWNPYKKIIDPAAFDNTDAVINLSGENIGVGKWTKQKKNKIIKSRKDTASLLAETINSLENPPELFISASATGFYGDRGDERINENSVAGDLFISDVCRTWEDSALLCNNSKTRVVILRTGVVLTPEGGALPLLLKGFYTGTAGIVGSGNQYVSWISAEDFINSLYRIIFDTNISGTVNSCSENPVKFKELIKDISKTIGLPAYLKIPEKAVKLLTGQRGYETVLCGAKVMPDKLLANNYKFIHNRPKDALKEMLGKEIAQHD